MGSCLGNRVMPNDLVMYVVVDREALGLPQCAVQSGHAIAELVHQHQELASVLQWVTEDKTLVLLAGSQKTMDKAVERCRIIDTTWAAFHEPDLDNHRTAIAFEPMTRQMGRRLFNRLPLLN